jgi:superfamily II DNA or RNA helicase
MLWLNDAHQPTRQQERCTCRLIVTLSLFLSRNEWPQAVGRVHRMGQKREVHVYRMAMTKSIDERVLEVGASRRGLSGNIKEDKAALNIREFDLLFNKVPMTANPFVESGGSSSEATAREAALASIAANNVLAAANTAQRIATSQNAAGIVPLQFNTDPPAVCHSCHCER